MSNDAKDKRKAGSPIEAIIIDVEKEVSAFFGVRFQRKSLCRRTELRTGTEFAVLVSGVGTWSFPSPELKFDIPAPSQSTTSASTAGTLHVDVLPDVP
jgi:hypothetical protein